MRITVLLLALSISFAAGAQTYFCTTEGAVCKYRRTIVSSGRTKWCQTLIINKVTLCGDGSRIVNYTSSFSGRKGFSSEPIRLNAVIDTGGNVCIRLSEAMEAVFRNFMPKAEISVNGGVTVLPSSMKAGDRLEDARTEVKAGLIRYTVAVSDRKVLRRESISTPAGDFDCIVVSEHKEEKAPGYSRITNAYTWYSPGVGMVRHDTYDKNMKLETSELLQSLK